MTPKVQPFWWFKPPAIICPEGEQVVNGGFETGDFTGWTNNGADISTQYVHSGTYSAFLYSASIQQDFATPILKECIESFGFWVYFIDTGILPDAWCDVYFSDGDMISVPILQIAGWTYYDILAQIPNGKSVSYFVFRAGSTYWYWLDDVSLIGTG